MGSLGQKKKREMVVDKKWFGGFERLTKKKTKCAALALILASLPLHLHHPLLRDPPPHLRPCLVVRCDRVTCPR